MSIMSINLTNVPFRIPDIILPNKSINLYTWSTIACDQFTSNQSYWESVKDIVHDDPSTLHITLPEIYLENQEKTQTYLTNIQQHMKQYRKNGIFDLHKDCLLRIQRTTKSNAIRSGLMVQVDLAQYDPHPHSTATIRATEAIVPTRLTKRIEVRKNTSLDFSHIIMLYEDESNVLMSELSKHIRSTKYETTLMLDGGHIRADVCDTEKSVAILKRYFENMKIKIAKQGNNALFIIGDGNHSLMAAKQAWLDMGADMQHPERWALVELVNIHDSGLPILPIHRILCKTSCENFFNVLQNHGILSNKKTYSQNNEVQIIHEKTEYTWTPYDTSQLSIEIFESIIEKHKELYHSIDFIHDESEVRNHASCTSSNTIGFIFPDIQKDALFQRVHENKIFPRKSFALGHSVEKRYYVEACDRSVSCNGSSL